MSSITQCPACHTRFNISAAQLSAHDGLVRCGRCQTVFNAAEQIAHALEVAQRQLSLPIDLEEPAISAVSSTVLPVHLTEQEPPTSWVNSPASLDVQPESTSSKLDLNFLDEQKISNKTMEIEGVAIHPLPATRQTPSPRWLVPLSLGLLSMLLLVQLLFYFRNEWVLQFPASKPLWLTVCARLNCRIQLPHKINQFSIESSDMVAEPTHPNLVILSAWLHNMAGHPQAFPWLALTVTDASDQVQARRLFRPEEYLSKEEKLAEGIAANREMEIKLHLNLSDLNSAGYKLFLFYPKTK